MTTVTSPLSSSPYDLAALASYVRFYLAVSQQILSAWRKLSEARNTMREELTPFTLPLAPLQNMALVEAAEPPPDVQPDAPPDALPGAPPGPDTGAPAPASRTPYAPPALAELWQPEDPEALSGLTDIYEIVGRFSFQGVDNENLSRVQSLVSAARNEIVLLRARLVDLTKLPELSLAAATRLGETEASAAEAAQQAKLAAFGPLADMVLLRARQTSEAVRAVHLPDLGHAESAADDYRRYVAKVDQVYQTCLPFLRKAIEVLYEFVGAEIPSAWPERLPLVAEIPPELLSLPPADAPELGQAEASLRALGEEQQALGRAQGEIAAVIARVDAETTAALARDQDIEAEIQVALLALDHAITEEQAAGMEGAIAGYERQKADRVQSAGDVWQRHRRTEASIKALEEEILSRAQEITEAQDELAAAQKSEPVLFGKDEWRARVASLEARLTELRSTYAQRQSMLNQLRIDLSAISVQVQTETAQMALVERTLADVRAKLGVHQATLSELATRLGPSRPPRGTTPADAQRLLDTRQQSRRDLAERMERLRGEGRRQKEENVRVLARLKQIELERQHAHARLQSAQVAATQGREAALQRLATERRTAAQQHVSEVLSSLEKALGGIETNFIAPARAALLAPAEQGPPPSQVVREHGEKIAPVVASLLRALDPELLAQEAALSQVQREFCDMAVGACKAAWG
ncbi:hypothetical protein [Chondromyces apiculatus]|uniref:Uncharacterized protein n=1 Tax=Chondromyces apiculatus DSM 436 TaxID=1192034 RepID=A0A017SVP3_9BACT|nr:hypothetical protein [Chondromyces apiculatus]EYF00675.1 Hypothetical protein CAP_0366 [Chondromyces apiculatus DSM 436]